MGKGGTALTARSLEPITWTPFKPLALLRALYTSSADAGQQASLPMASGSHEPPSLRCPKSAVSASKVRPQASSVLIAHPSASGTWHLQPTLFLLWFGWSTPHLAFPTISLLPFPEKRTTGSLALGPVRDVYFTRARDPGPRAASTNEETTPADPLGTSGVSISRTTLAPALRLIVFGGRKKPTAAEKSASRDPSSASQVTTYAPRTSARREAFISRALLSDEQLWGLGDQGTSDFRGAVTHICRWRGSVAGGPHLSILLFSSTDISPKRNFFSVRENSEASRAPPAPGPNQVLSESTAWNVGSHSSDWKANGEDPGLEWNSPHTSSYGSLRVKNGLA